MNEKHIKCQYVQTYTTLCRNKVKAARGFLSTQRERRTRRSETCSRCSSGAGGAALGHWVTPLRGGGVRAGWGPGGGSPVGAACGAALYSSPWLVWLLASPMPASAPLPRPRLVFLWLFNVFRWLQAAD